MAPTGPLRAAPPGRPDAQARRIIEQIRSYVAANPTLRGAHGARAIAAAATEAADEAVVGAHDAGASWAAIAREIGLQPGSVNQTATRVRTRREQLEDAR